MTEGDGRLIAGRYRLRESLGRGGMGAVWLADDDYLSRRVAIKEIQPHGRQLRASDPEVRRALREARAAAKVGDHVGIVTVLDVVTDDHGLPWIVMQLLNGPTLSAVLRESGTMPTERAARIGMQLLTALDYAHQANVLHRDVKPSNVVLVGDQPVLTDFGIAVIDGESFTAEHGQIVGSPSYMAPERFRGETAQPASDVWSVGILLYAMVVGRTPFDRGDVGATQGAVLNLQPDPDPRLGRLGPVIGGLLRKKPADRMTARQAIALLAAISASPVSASSWASQRRPPVTLPDSADMERTVTTATEPCLRPAAPSPYPSYPSPPGSVRHDDPTILPGRSRPRGRRGRLIAGAAALVAALSSVVLVVSLPGDDANGAPPPSAAQPSTTMPPLTPVEENNLGFSIDIPEDWDRVETSPERAAWAAKNTRPTVGPLRLTVRVNSSGTDSASETVAELQRQVQADDGIRIDDQPSSVDVDATSAQFEYAYHRPGSRAHFHELTRAVVSDQRYLVTFELWADEALRAHWANAEPLVEKILDSFEPTG